MNAPPRLPSDRQLLDAARRGDEAAWAELLQRHRSAIERVAAASSGRRVGRRVDDAMKVARTRLLRGPVVPADAAEIRAVRPALIASMTDGFYGPAFPGVLTEHDPETPAPPPSGDEELLAVAFASLPEPWQTVLWHRHVDRESVETIATIVGRDAGDIDELVATAERGLTDAFFREYVATGPFRPDGARILALLPGYASDALTDLDRGLVDEHLRHANIAVADQPARLTATGTSIDLAPPQLRRHDAVDTRRLLGLVGALDERLAAAIAPGVLGDEGAKTAVAGPTPVVGAAGRTVDDDPSDGGSSKGGERRRLLLAVAASLVVVSLLVAAAFIFGSGGDDATTTPTSANPVGVDPDADPADDPDDDGGVTPPDDSGGDTTTTSLELRPPADGQRSTIEVSLDPDAAPLGFAPAAPVGSAEVVASFPAPVLAGGSGTVDFEVTNPSDTEVLVGLILGLPSGVRFDRGDGGDCLDPDDDSPRCTVAVAPGSAARLSVRVLLERRVVGTLEVSGDLSEPVETSIAAIPNLVHSSVGQGDVVVIGNTVTRCSPALASAEGIDCSFVGAGDGTVVDRWDVPIEFVGGDARFGLFNASTAELVIPEGSEVVAAHLYWAGDLDERGQTIPDDGRNTTIALGLPGGDVETIEAGRVVLGDIDATQYLGSNDVTELVQAGGPGRYTVGNVHTVEAQGSFGAWALAVVYDHPDVPRRQRLVTQPFSWVAPEDGDAAAFDYAVDIPIPADGRLAGELDVFGLEGELSFAPELFLAGDQVLGGDNPFDSSIGNTARQPAEINNLGVDIDTYALDIDASTGILPLRVTSENDGVRVAVLGLTVDLPS